MLYYVIRRKKDRVCYGKNYHYKTTGNTLPRHGFYKELPPYLYSSYERADLACMTNYVIASQGVEIFQWSTSGMKRVKKPATTLVAKTEEKTNELG